VNNIEDTPYSSVGGSMIKKDISDQRGFMLVEMIIALTLLGIVLAGAFQLFFYGNGSTVSSIARENVVRDTNVLMLTMDTQVRNAVPSAAGKALTFTLTELDIYQDTDGDGTADHEIIYRLDASGQVLKRAVMVTKADGSYPLPQTSDWSVVLAGVKNTPTTGVFSLPDLNLGSVAAAREIVEVYLLVDNPQSPLVVPLELKKDLTVRTPDNT
jgi:prepilin-type N-terminal cleavage/methylation domain-containing protein